MPISIQRRLSIITVLGLLLLAGCGSAPVLVSKSATVPAGVDLSGHWQLRKVAGSMRMPYSEDTGIRVTPSARQSGNRSRNSSRRRSSGMSAQVFLKYGESLKITQTAHGMFISYDRSVVREFTFGENRQVSVGPIEAMRVSGWQDHTFVVETLDKDGNILFENWRLDGTGEELIRDISLRNGDDEKFLLTQIFDRK